MQRKQSKSNFNVGQKQSINKLGSQQNKNKLSQQQNHKGCLELKQDEKIQYQSSIGLEVKEETEQKNMNNSSTLNYSTALRNEIQQIISQTQNIELEQGEEKSCSQPKHFSFPSSITGNDKISCLLLQKQQRNQNTMNLNSVKSSQMGSILASTATHSKTLKVINNRYESCNKFFLILDENNEEEQEIINQSNQDDLSCLSKIEHSALQNDYTDDGSSLIEIITREQQQKRQQISIMPTTDITAISMIDNYNQTVRAQKVYESKKPRAFNERKLSCNKQEEMIMVQKLPQNQGDINSDILSTTIMNSPIGQFKNHIFMFSSIGSSQNINR